MEELQGGSRYSLTSGKKFTLDGGNSRSKHRGRCVRANEAQVPAVGPVGAVVVIPGWPPFETSPAYAGRTNLQLDSHDHVVVSDFDIRAPQPDEIKGLYFPLEKQRHVL